MYTAIRTGSVEAAVFIGGSNAGKPLRPRPGRLPDHEDRVETHKRKREQANSGSSGQCSAGHPFRPLHSGQLELHEPERGGEHLSDQPVS